MPQRLQKLIAASGFCSRRKADELIAQGKVLVNGQVASLGAKASLEDIISVNGHALTAPQDKKYIILNKPKGYTCTTAIFEKEKNIYSLLPPDCKNLAIAGRLDKESTGLLLLTNDGDLLAKLTHPKFLHEKTYQVKIEAPLGLTAHRVIQEFKNGIDIGEGEGIVFAKKIKPLGINEFEISIAQGKKRQIRRMFTTIGAKVYDLKRIKIAGLMLNDLPLGKMRKLSPEEIKKLKTSA